MGVRNIKYGIGVLTIFISIIVMLNTGYMLYKAGLLTHSLLFTYSLVMIYETLIMLFKKKTRCD